MGSRTSRISDSARDSAWHAPRSTPPLRSTAMRTLRAPPEPLTATATTSRPAAFANGSMRSRSCSSICCAIRASPPGAAGRSELCLRRPRAAGRPIRGKKKWAGPPTRVHARLRACSSRRIVARCGVAPLRAALVRSGATTGRPLPAHACNAASRLRSALHRSPYQSPPWRATRARARGARGHAGTVALDAARPRRIPATLLTPRCNLCPPPTRWLGAHERSNHGDSPRIHRRGLRQLHLPGHRGFGDGRLAGCQGLLAPRQRDLPARPGAPVTDVPIAGSFRDPHGQVFTRGGLVHRLVTAEGARDYEQLMGSGLYDALVSERLLVEHAEVDDPQVHAVDAAVERVLLPAQVPFISYPWEWCPGQLRAAALATLRAQELALDHGMSLRDASAFNVQFLGGR